MVSEKKETTRELVAKLIRQGHQTLEIEIRYKSR
jgi:hypothetical protein